MIHSFADRLTHDIFNGVESKRVRRLDHKLVRVAARKLDIINAAHALDDLRSPPGNRLESLKGDLVGHHSIRNNDQWRLVFRWVDGSAHDVAFTDDHGALESR